MVIRIGSKYEETKQRLIEKIRTQKIEGVEGVAEDHVCYFCASEIDGRMRILKEAELIKGVYEETTFYSHEGCFQMVIHPEILN